MMIQCFFIWLTSTVHKGNLGNVWNLDMKLFPCCVLLFINNDIWLKLSIKSDNNSASQVESIVCAGGLGAGWHSEPLVSSLWRVPARVTLPSAQTTSRSGFCHYSQVSSMFSDFHSVHQLQTISLPQSVFTSTCMVLESPLFKPEKQNVSREKNVQLRLERSH